MQEDSNSAVMGRALRLLPMIVVMITIFIFSMAPAEKSARTSGGILAAIVDCLEKMAHTTLSPETVDILHTLIRKCAHITEYAILGATVVFAYHPEISEFVSLRSDGASTADCGRSPLFITIPLAVSALYSASDEIHQLFVPGRSGEVLDVIIDSCGALIGILIMNHIYRRREKRAGKENDSEMQSMS